MAIPDEEKRIMEFHKKIINLKTDDVTYTEVLIEYCEKNNMDFEDIAPLISPFLKSEIHKEAISSNMLKGSRDFAILP